MLEESVGLAAVTILAILEQAYFCLQVIQARRKFGVPPPATSGPAEFQRVFRAQANSSEYFPIFISALWLSGIFFSQGLSSACGLLYLGGRLAYFRGYSQSPEQRLGPLYFSSQVLWLLIGSSGLGVLLAFLRLYLAPGLLGGFGSALGLD
ncbi:unnamed protein product [Tetraodon nigroviridis]|uniref:Chromosome 1 SCAF14742, whole genome shotgun sequence n=1 Tax=Tetraodon nigroviridis TaxID=99883 RepID=Q4S494_TETNG|nr:unnamed protein product [Tetraodon nigroviridis]